MYRMNLPGITKVYTFGPMNDSKKVESLVTCVPKDSIPAESILTLNPAAHAAKKLHLMDGYRFSCCKMSAGFTIRGNSSL
jgi:hypothetical protein